jgi:RNA polymerase sigma factor (sigma-70 family)
VHRGLIARLFRDRAPEAGNTATDTDLLARFVGSGDEAAFEVLVWRHAALVFGVCRRVIGDEHRAEDAFQASFLVLARKAGSVRGANLAGWLFRVARRVAIRARKQAATLANREATLAEEPPCPALPHPVENREIAAVLDQEIAALPERFRRVIVLCYLGGHTTEEAACLLGCPRGTVLSRLATARQRLVARLTRRGIGLGVAGVTGLAGVPEVTAVTVVVPKTVRLALDFAVHRTRAVLGQPSCIHLAEGVLRTMQTAKILTIVGLFVVTAGLVCGVGAVTAQPAKDRSTVEIASPPGPPPTPSKPPAPSRSDLEIERAHRAKRLAEIASELERTIRTKEQEILQLHDHGALDEAAIARLNKRLDEVDTEIARTERTIFENKARIQELINARTAPPKLTALELRIIEQNLGSIGEITELTELKKTTYAANLTVREVQAQLAEVQKALNDKLASERRKMGEETLTRDAHEREYAIATTTEKNQAMAIQLATRQSYRAKLQEELMKATTWASVARRLNRGLDPLRDALTQVERERLQIELDLAKSAAVSSSPISNSQFDAMMNELRELRKEVAEIRKDIRQQKAP